MTKLKVGLAGCGHISGAHLAAWSNASSAEVSSVFDLDRALARQTARKHGVDAAAESYEELVASCDLIDICTPPSSHASLLRQALTAGRHIVIEKPVVASADEWHELRPLIDASSATLSVVHNLKFTRCVETAKRWIDLGRIGRVLRTDWSFLTAPAKDRMLDGSDHWSHHLPGGRWFETLPHFLYLDHYLGGALELASVSVANSPEAPRGVLADEALIMLRGSTHHATVHFSANCRLNHRWGIIVGSEGLIQLDLLADAASLSRLPDTKGTRGFARLHANAATTLLRALPDRLAYVRDRLRRLTPHARMIMTLDRHFRDQGPLPTTLAEVAYVVEHSSRIGQAIDEQLRSRLT